MNTAMIKPAPIALPPDPDAAIGGPSNDDRAEWAEESLAVFRNRTSADLDEGQDISDLLADIMHACDRRGEDFSKLLNWAWGNYREETSGEGKQTL